MNIRFLLFFVLVFMGASESQSQTLVEQGELTSTTVTVSLSGLDSAREIYCLRTTPGQAKRRSGTKLLFTPYSTLVRNLARTKPGSAQLTLFRQLASKGKVACKSVPPAPTPTPGASPTATPAPVATATPTPAPQTGNFDAQGNVTAAGRVAFGIPSGVTANVSRGKTVAQSFCTGCHSEKTNRTYSYLDQSIRSSPMLYDDSQLSRPQQLADLTAYLNRFRP